MSAIPGDLETETQPPMAVPLGHFVVALALLVMGVGAGVARDVVPGLAGPAHVHLFVVGFVCVTIMGAMTQFVPVWAGVPIHSRRLAAAELPVVAAGLAGVVAAFLSGSYAWLAAAGLVVAVGLWLFVYNLGRTLARARPLDVTLYHFAVALAWFALVPPAGVALAASYAGLAVPWSVAGLRGAHVTLAVFGAVLSTVVGALYQLSTMFTQTDPGAVDEYIQRAETGLYPAGVGLLAGGRLLADPLVARAGTVLVLGSLLGVAAFLGRRLTATSVTFSPMLRRYAVVACALSTWVVLTAPRWLSSPLADPLGGTGLATLLLLGVVGFVVVGTLYHVVPFIVWEHRYSDRLGFEQVPLVDDLYDSRLARLDFLATVAGTAGLVVGDAGLLTSAASTVAGLVAFAGFALAAVNLVRVVVVHGDGLGTLAATLARPV